MLNLAHSKATFEVLKRGGTTDIVQQAELCQHIGTNVCPQVYTVGKGFYTMEMLSEVSQEELNNKNMYKKMFAILQKNVWSRPAIQTPDPNWTLHLKAWIKKTTDIVKPEIVDKIYPSSTVHTCLIHGDPTLANLMMRRNELLLIDPVPCRLEIPSIMQVDVGKMLQSAAGWEHALDPRFPEYQSQRVLFILNFFIKEQHEYCLFWAMINCLRVIPRATKPEVKDWAIKSAKMFYGKIK